MALIVEDGTGKTDADAYEDIAFVTAWIDAYGDSTAWAALAVDAQEDAIRTATRHLDLTYLELWKGRRRTRDQSLAWPRMNVTDEDDYVVDDDVVPIQVQNAMAYLAERVGVQGDVLMPVETDHGIDREKIKAAVVERDVSYTGRKTTRKRYDMVDQFLAPLLTGGRYSHVGPATRG
jgi:hypothetical protein